MYILPVLRKVNLNVLLFQFLLCHHTFVPIVVECLELSESLIKGRMLDEITCLILHPLKIKFVHSLVLSQFTCSFTFVCSLTFSCFSHIHLFLSHSLVCSKSSHPLSIFFSLSLPPPPSLSHRFLPCAPITLLRTETSSSTCDLLQHTYSKA